MKTSALQLPLMPPGPALLLASGARAEPTNAQYYQEG
jgi:hypothetical protein